MKIAMIGAGSFVFSKILIRDIFSFPELTRSTIFLMDPDKVKLEIISAYAQKLIRQNDLPTKVLSTTDRQVALKDARYVITIFDIGGLESRKLDIEIPRKYGVNQAIGDTIGPGGVFKALRVIPALLDICRDMEKLCPEALLINYTNPMAINCWAMNKYSDIKNIGLCHGVEHTVMMISHLIGARYEEISHLCAGINHMTWFLQLKWKEEDVYPKLRQKMKEPGVYSVSPIRFELMERMGYFVSESDYHTAEYMPFFKDRFDNLEVIMEEDKEKFKEENLKRPMSEWGEFYIRSKTDDGNEVEQKIPIGFNIKAYSEKKINYHFEQIKREIESEKLIPINRSCEYASRIIHSMETGTPRKISGNVMNNGLITNLPSECCVELPCFVDRQGIHPIHIGKLPPQCAGLTMSNIRVQELAVEGVVKKDKKTILRAIMLDPFTSSCIRPSEIENMVMEMYDAEEGRLAQIKE